MIQFPTKDEITQVLVTNLLGSGKTISDLPNQWVIKSLIIGLREAIYMFVVVLKLVFDQLTASGAQGSKLEEFGYEWGVDRKQATAAIHSVTLKKSSPVASNTNVPDYFLLTTTPYGSNPPMQFRVVPGQNKFIPAGGSQVTGVLVQCTEVGTSGNVLAGAINLIAQAGFDIVSDSTLVTAGADIEDIEVYRSRILERKRNPGRGGTVADYKIWAESFEGVASALVLPINRGPGTVDIVITGVEGMPSASLITECQEFIDTFTPADLDTGAIQVIAPTQVNINITLSGCVWAIGYTAATGAPIVRAALESYIISQSNINRVVRVMDIIAVAKEAFLSSDITKAPVLVDFILSGPTTNKVLASTEMAIPGAIVIT
ncbi:baseplate J/gp47 family protein [Bacillus sp. 3255]|uniref:baseplate J/gp47 family protein n=1 Tax=Bacillus sp. 3255 TaxID=2817904 RepID=UPI002859206E|nr:baseplate J/gp47 family protein [Bacillus sp. 3255]MDR6883015.1 putative phage protein gp47/JayE [Bacillus sp. 3255]